MTSDIGRFTTPSAERPPSAVYVDWAAVEGRLGLRVPAGYKRLAGR
ncbi:hypothetical protein AB0L59_41195 [Streptomyces sp. NPDC052109]